MLVQTSRVIVFFLYLASLPHNVLCMFLCCYIVQVLCGKAEQLTGVIELFNFDSNRLLHLHVMSYTVTNILM